MKFILRKCRFFLTGILLLSAGFFVVEESKVEAAEVSLVQGVAIQYMGYSTHYYYVNGNMAYCLEPDMKSPGNGQFPSDTLDKNQLLSKAMYYVYGGPGFEAYMKPDLTGGWDSDDRAYCLSHCILSYIYDGCDPNSAGFIGLNEDIRSAVINFTGAITSWPNIPDTDISLSDNSLQASFAPEEKLQRTESVSCLGDVRNSITLPMPKGVTLVNETKGRADQGNVVINGGDTFHLAADVTYGNGQSWESGKLYGAIQESWRTLVVKTGAGSQDIGTGEVVTVETTPITLQAKWMEKPKLNVTKQADKESKLYKVGDVITYTIDVTQSIQNAVAKQVEISDTILTEGVKLQKNSIVLMDENQSVISDAIISVKGNTYTIRSGNSLEFLQSVESGEKFTVEYQVIITDEAVIGKEIENEVVVRAQNAEEVKEKEIVKVEEPPKEEPKIPEPKAPDPEVVIKETPIIRPVSVKTGDEENLMLLIILSILSCTAIFICGRIARKIR